MVDNYLHDISMALAEFGPNKASIPIATDFHDGEWWVYIDVNSKRATFDIETHSTTLRKALVNALGHVRRELYRAA